MAYGSLLADVVQSSTAGTPPQFNDGNGTQVGTLCRAWVNYNGTSGSTAIRGSFNVSSVTRNGTGDYTVNFTNAMPDANYSATTVGGNAGTAGFDLYAPWVQAPTTTTFRVGIYNGSSATQVDCSYTQIAFFR